MHDNETKDQFVTLRAEGQSFGDISTQLGIAKSTLHRWEDEREADIARLRRIQWLETEAECGRRIEDHLTHLIYHMMDCEDRIKQFKTTEYSLRDAFAILRESRREYYRLRALLMGTGTTSRKSNKTERFAENAATNPRNTNDLQQPEPKSFDSVTPDVRRGQISRQPSESPNPQPANAVQDSATASNHSPERPSPSASPSVGDEDAFPESNKTERSAENVTPGPLNTNDLQQPKPASFDSVTPEVMRGHFSRQPSENPPVQPANAVQNSIPANDQSKIDDDFLGSVVINTLECGAGIVIKCLEAETAHRALKAGRSRARSFCRASELYLTAGQARETYVSQ